MRDVGTQTEAAVLAALVAHGHQVLIPFGEGHPYDLAVAGEGGRLVRVQCKTGRLRRGSVVFNCYSTDHGRGAGHYRGRADVFGIRCPDADRVFIVPVEVASTTEMRLRITPARNGQRLRTHDADAYDIARWDPLTASAASATDPLRVR
jgi:hypothetical protein